jgi:signal peptidase I
VTEDTVTDDERGDAHKEPTATKRKGHHVRSRRRTLIEWVVVLLVALAIAFSLRTFVFQVFFVPSTSMVPTLLVGDRIVVDKLFFDYHSLKEGDIVVFNRPPADTVCGSEEADLVKRVIGLPGQRISSRGNTIYINGKALKEPYLPSDDPLGAKAIVSEVIPKNQFFVMGDNRAVSCDSRYWGTISGSSIVGRVIAVIWRNGRPDLHTF